MSVKERVSGLNNSKQDMHCNAMQQVCTLPLISDMFEGAMVQKRQELERLTQFLVP